MVKGREVGLLSDQNDQQIEVDILVFKVQLVYTLMGISTLDVVKNH